MDVTVWALKPSFWSLGQMRCQGGHPDDGVQLDASQFLCLKPECRADYQGGWVPAGLLELAGHKLQMKMFTWLDRREQQADSWCW
jgi:hypothetical protein